jgi:hypothetical protein
LETEHEVSSGIMFILACCAFTLNLIKIKIAGGHSHGGKSKGGHEHGKSEKHSHGGKEHGGHGDEKKEEEA